MKSTTFLPPRMEDAGMKGNMLTKQQRQALKLFNEKALKLKESSFARQIVTQGLQISISAKENEYAQFQLDIPHSEAIESFVLTLRFFIQNNEVSSLANVATVYRKATNISDIHTKLFFDAHNKLNTLLDAGSMMTWDEKRLSHRDILDTFIYGALAHANPKKAAIYERWMADDFMKHFFTYSFVTTLMFLMNHIHYMRNVTSEVLNEDDSSPQHFQAIGDLGLPQPEA